MDKELKDLITAIMRGNLRDSEGVDDYLNRMVSRIKTMTQPKKPTFKGRTDKGDS